MSTQITEVTWAEIKDTVARVNPDLYASVESISPQKHHRLFKVKYQFGDYIVKNGIAQLPTQQGQLTPLNAVDLPKKLQKHLGYSPIPLFLLLEKSCEIFVTLGERIVPLNFVGAGNLLGEFETLDLLANIPTTPLWDVTAGARSIFMLPHVTEKQGIMRLIKTYKLPHGVQLKQLNDHWHIFTQIMHSAQMPTSWRCEALFFAKDWFTHEDETGWSLFYRYLFKRGWTRIQYTLHQIETSLIWQAFIEAIEQRNLKPRPYIIDTIKHLFAMAVKRYPGFVPIDQQGEAAPIQSIQQAFTDTYMLKHYFPSIMGPSMLGNQPQQAIYYSLALPTLLEGFPGERKIARVMPDLREIKLLIDTFQQRAKHSAPLQALQNIRFDYFHSEKDMYEEIALSNQIPENDSRFSYPAQGKNAAFGRHSAFWRGCIKISYTTK